MRPLVLVLLAVLSGASLAGCVKEAEPAAGVIPTSGAPAPPTQSDRPDDAEIIEGSEGSYACAPPGTGVKVDPNRTFEGGAHQHDYWGGQDKLTIFEGDITKFGGGGWFMMPGAVVQPGTGRVEFVLRWTDAVAALPETRTLFWDMPGDKKTTVDMFSQKFEVKGTNHSIPVNLSNNDPPHYTSSTWSFKLDPASPTHVTWIIHRGYDCLPIDPPHYEYWGGATQKLLWEGQTNHANMVKGCPPNHPVGEGCGGSALYYGMTPQGNSSVPPGSKLVRVSLDWTNSVPNQPPLCLLYKTAVDSGSTAGTWRRATTIPESTATHRVFEIPLAPEHWDSPYQPRTKWNYNWCFDNGTNHAVLGESGAFNGNVKWKIEAFRAG